MSMSFLMVLASASAIAPPSGQEAVRVSDFSVKSSYTLDLPDELGRPGIDYYQCLANSIGNNRNMVAALNSGKAMAPTAKDIKAALTGEPTPRARRALVGA